MTTAVKENGKRGGKTDKKTQNPLHLPRSVARLMRQCVETHNQTGAEGIITYLWINVADTSPTPCGRDVVGLRRLSVTEWLNVVDEAASLGVHCLLVCVGASVNKYPEIWDICRWGQKAHEMKVGIHTSAAKLTETEIIALTGLDLSRTCLFVPKAHVSAMRSLEKRGIHLCGAEVTAEDHTPPCDMPQNMVFVGPGGMLYTCGLVLGNTEFLLGNVLERPLKSILKDPSLPHTVPPCVPKTKHGCDACPPIMAQRMMKGR